MDRFPGVRIPGEKATRSTLTRRLSWNKGGEERGGGGRRKDNALRSNLAVKEIGFRGLLVIWHWQVRVASVDEVVQVSHE
jgi:hypothetical protein